MQVFRLANSVYCDDLSGIGAALYPGRWNKTGVPVLYTSERAETALLEQLVHIPPLMLPDLTLLSLEIPDDSIMELNTADLPENWHHYPAPTLLTEIGQAWIEAGVHLALMVPSAVMHASRNVLLNTRHLRMQEVKTLSKEPFYFDTRLLRHPG